MTTFQSGAKRNMSDEKEDYVESLSWLALRRFAKYMKTQEKTYGRGNWKKGIPVESYEQSLMRHLQKYLANKYDGASLEPDVDHLAAAWFNLQGLLHEIEKSNIIYGTPGVIPDPEVENVFSKALNGGSPEGKFQAMKQTLQAEIAFRDKIIAGLQIENQILDSLQATQGPK